MHDASVQSSDQKLTASQQEFGDRHALPCAILFRSPSTAC